MIKHNMIFAVLLILMGNIASAMIPANKKTNLQTGSEIFPYEVILLIFDHFPFKDKLSLISTCKKYRNGNLEKEYFNSSSNNINFTWENVCSKGFPKNFFQVWPGIPVTIALAVDNGMLEYVKGAKHITFSSPYLNFDFDGVRYNLDDTISLNVVSTQINFFHRLCDICFPNLRELSIENFLTARGRNYDYEDRLISLDLEHFTNLRYLKLHHVAWLEGDLFSELNHLTHLDLGINEYIALDFLKNLPNLKNLKIELLRDYRGHNYQAIDEYLIGFTDLEVVELKRIPINGVCLLQNANLKKVILIIKKDENQGFAEAIIDLVKENESILDLNKEEREDYVDLLRPAVRHVYVGGIFSSEEIKRVRIGSYLVLTISKIEQGTN